MKSAVIILALVAAVSAQQYYNGQYNNNGQYNPFGRYNQYNQYNRNQYRYNPYSTPAPFRYTPTVSAVTPTPFVASTVAPTDAAVVSPVVVAQTRVYSDGYNAEILRSGNENAPDGSYNYFYETSNGIAAQEQGTPRAFGGNPPVVPVVKQGSFSWTAPDGQPIVISYVADENGYQPTGNAIPTPPPVPAQIARALEYIARTAPAQKK